jgi:hypothetical protein
MLLRENTGAGSGFRTNRMTGSFGCCALLEIAAVNKAVTQLSARKTLRPPQRFRRATRIRARLRIPIAFVSSIRTLKLKEYRGSALVLVQNLSPQIRSTDEIIQS